MIIRSSRIARGPAGSRRRLMQEDNAIRRVVRKGTHQDTVHHRKDRGVRANPEREGENHNGGVDRISCETAEAIGHVLAKVFEEAKKAIVHNR